ncbi:MAG: hypothetical protein ACJA02_000137 [Myxococcota bacterium]|jgi:hypothetical protein
MWPFDACCGDEFDYKKIQNPNIFQFKCEWIHIIINSATILRDISMSEGKEDNKVGIVFKKCADAAFIFSKECLETNPISISFNCQTLNEMAGLEASDKSLLVLKFENSDLKQDEIARIILPVFLVMANLFNKSGNYSEDIINTVEKNIEDLFQKEYRDGIEEDNHSILPKNYSKEALEQANNLHEAIFSTKKYFNNAQHLSIRHVTEIAGSIICEQIENSSNKKTTLTHLATKGFKTKLKGKIIPSSTVTSVRKTINKLRSQQPPSTGQLH